MFTLRSYKESDKSAVSDLAVRAFEEYQHQYKGWSDFVTRLRSFPANAQDSKVIVATQNNFIIGAVGYVPAHAKKPAHFPANTPIIKMLVVSPNHRGLGVGKQLTLECLRIAKQNSCKSIALHTSQIMRVALPMYLRMGFVKAGKAPDVHGVSYGVYTKILA